MIVGDLTHKLTRLYASQKANQSDETANDEAATNLKVEAEQKAKEAKVSFTIQLYHTFYTAVETSLTRSSNSF